jgi:hypothetical protein
LLTEIWANPSLLNGELIRHKVDCVGVKVQIRNVSINILVVYIPPATPVFVYSHFFEKLELCHIFDANFILVEDFNVPLLDNQIGPLSNCINNFISFVEAIQINDVLNVNRRCLDLIFCPSSSSFTLKQSDFPLVPEDSHHPALVFNLNFSVEKVKDFEFSKSMMYNFKRTNFVELYNLFLDTDWRIVTECNDVNIACDNLYEIINSYFDKTVPSSFGKRESFPEWFSAGTKALIRSKSTILSC